MPLETYKPCNSRFLGYEAKKQAVYYMHLMHCPDGHPWIIWDVCVFSDFLLKHLKIIQAELGRWSTRDSLNNLFG